jgi:hypothetical protein
VDFLKKVRRKALYIAVCLFVIGVLIDVAGIYIGETDDAPGAALIVSADDRLGGAWCESMAHNQNGYRL